jgi:hypothetical protein
MRRLLATGAFAVLIAGCGHDLGGLESSDSPVARYDWSSSDGGMDALLEGTLEMRDGCLVVNPSWDDVDTVVIPVFPRTYASWDADSEVLAYAGRDYGIGDSIWTGGGFVPPPPGAVIPASCAVEVGDDVFLVQSTSLEPPGG